MTRQQPTLEEKERVWVKHNGPMTDEEVEIAAQQVIEDGDDSPDLLNALDRGSGGRVRARVAELRVEQERLAEIEANKGPVRKLADKLTAGLTGAGGRRPGAGRPEIQPSKRKSNRVSFGMDKPTWKRFAAAKQPDEKDSETAARLVLWALDHMPDSQD